MMITGRQDDTHWRNFFKGAPEVRLDGVLLDKVIACDDLAGWADVYRMDKGRPVIINGDPVIYRVFGRVEITGPRVDL